MGKTSIEWTDASWNPIMGCTEISPGCANCYAARLAATRLKNHPDYKELAVIGTHCRGLVDEGKTSSARWHGAVRFLPERLEEPLHWRKPRRIFVCDMGDLFHEAVKEEWIHKVIGTINRCPQHTFQILTKRAKRMHEFFSGERAWLRFRNLNDCHWPLPNVWLGVSVENQHFADERIPLLLSTPAAVRFISAEPLLGPVNVETFTRSNVGTSLDWVICGGESGPNARPMHPDWARSLRDQCQTAGVPFFFKQWGEYTYYDAGPEMFKESHRIEVGPGASERTRLWAVRVGKKKAGRLLDGREWNEFPKNVETSERANVSTSVKP